MISPIDHKRIEYTKLLVREKKAEAYLNDPVRTQAEIDKWTPEYKQLLLQLENLLSEIRHYTPDNINLGWPEMLKPNYQTIKDKEIKPKEKPITEKKQELKTAKLF